MAEDKKKEEIAAIDITEEYLKERIYEIRGQRVILDADLSEIYGYTTKGLKDVVTKSELADMMNSFVSDDDDDDKWLVLNASFHQAETIKTHLEQQMDNLDVTDTHYDKKYQIYRDDWMLNMIE